MNGMPASQSRVDRPQAGQGRTEPPGPPCLTKPTCQTKSQPLANTGSQSKPLMLAIQHQAQLSAYTSSTKVIRLYDMGSA
ncbi:hypothetical protein BaRGS_00010221 [Batillaria attramentaria]|uniref:Uncharacterized protein n=1 Tax=Batillaria attramentaria TaxID=370345 RepID=A0ABD0LH37_9CAEN